jgi:hypothetical protein
VQIYRLSRHQQDGCGSSYNLSYLLWPVIPPLRRICEELPPPVLNNPFLTCNELTSDKKTIEQLTTSKGAIPFHGVPRIHNTWKEKKMLLWSSLLLLACMLTQMRSSALLTLGLSWRVSHPVDLVAKEIDHIQAKLSRSTICHLGIPRVSPRVSDSHTKWWKSAHTRERMHLLLH